MKLLFVLALTLQLAVPTLQEIPTEPKVVAALPPTDKDMMAGAEQLHKKTLGMEPKVNIRYEDYEVNLDSLCPVAPNEEALLCENSYNLAQQVNLITIPKKTIMTVRTVVSLCCDRKDCSFPVL